RDILILDFLVGSLPKDIQQIVSNDIIMNIYGIKSIEIIGLSRSWEKYYETLLHFETLGTYISIPDFISHTYLYEMSNLSEFRDAIPIVDGHYKPESLNMLRANNEMMKIIG